MRWMRWSSGSRAGRKDERERICGIVKDDHRRQQVDRSQSGVSDQANSCDAANLYGNLPHSYSFRCVRPGAGTCLSLAAAFDPCIPTRGTKVPDRPEWIHEIKHDGYREVTSDFVR